MSEKMNFEKSMQELEKIAAALESGSSGLEESLKLFESGVKLSGQCMKMLDDAEQKVSILLKNDSMKEEDFSVKPEEE